MHLPRPALGNVLLLEPAFGRCTCLQVAAKQSPKGQQQNCSLRILKVCSGGLAATSGTHFSRGALFSAGRPEAQEGTNPEQT